MLTPSLPCDDHAIAERRPGEQGVLGGKLRERRSAVDVKYLTAGTEMREQIDAARLVHLLQKRLGVLKLRSLGVMLAQEADGTPRPDGVQTIDRAGVLSCLRQIGAAEALGDRGAAALAAGIFDILVGGGAGGGAAASVDLRMLACTLAPLMAPMARPAELIRFTFDIFDVNRDHELDQHEIKQFFDMFRAPVMVR